MNKGWLGRVRRLAMVCLGAVIIAANIKSFVRVGGLYPGGVSGLTLLIQGVFQRFAGLEVPYTLITLLLNAVPISIGFLFIGKKFTLYSCVVILLTGVLADTLPGYPITSDPLLISVFGGIINAIGISLCLLAGATSGGTDFIAIFMAERHNRDVWNFIFAGNVVILLVAGLLFGWEKALYSIIFQFTSTQVLGVVYKRYQMRTLFIITQKPEQVYQEIAQHTHHGATLFYGTGLYQQQQRAMVYSVVAADEIKEVLTRVRATDQHAFINCLKTDSLTGRFYRRPND